MQCALIAASALVWFYAALVLARSIYNGGIVMSKTQVEEEWEEATSNKIVWVLMLAAMVVCLVAVLLVYVNGGM
jgi:hypothetical protein